ncbi:recombination regulator RecX [Eupransor demetentiae]|uniref:Regulatory protein RecX n=1 Tax=Eupransor demetentiae TaxID=3109584 RepID=A0ABM9N3D0_9LACO|nr:SOS response regulatory protein OraA/RecX [Lactobacillaceae bacterium LMG 33000]
MKKITRIATQKRAGRYNIELDGRFAFGLSESVLVKFGLAKGRELDDELIARIQHEDDIAQALKLALNYLGPSLRTVQQIQKRLLDKEVQPAIADQVIEQLKEQGYLDDASYAKHYLVNKKVFQPKGPLLISRDLKQAGVSDEIIEATMPDYTWDEQIEIASKIASKVARSHRREPQRSQVQRINQSLVQKGFSFDVAQRVIELLEPEPDPDLAGEFLQRQAEKLTRRYSRKMSGSSLRYKVKSMLYQKGFDGDAIDRVLDQVLEQE